MLISWGNVWLTDRRSLIKRIDRWWFRLRAWVMARHGQFEHLTVQCFTTALHRWSIVSYFMWCFIQMLETIMMMFKLTWRNWRWLWQRERMLRFTRYHKDTIQERLAILIIICYKLIGVYVCQKLPKWSLVWQSYCKRK